MISLFKYRILKGTQAQDEVMTAGTQQIFETFDLSKPVKKAEPDKKTEKPGPPPEEAILQDRLWKAEALLERAREEAENIRQEAYEEGFEQGKEEGRQAGREAAYQEEQQTIKEELHNLAQKIGQYAADMEIQKEKVLEEYLDDLKNISLAIGEKIVQTSLKSSSEVIKRMIVAATEKLKKTAWAKIYVARTNEELDIQGDLQLLKELAKLSDNVKIVVMEDAEPGTCIIELPQEIIDISTGTQMENIRDILNNARL